MLILHGNGYMKLESFNQFVWATLFWLHLTSLYSIYFECLKGWFCGLDNGLALVWSFELIWGEYMSISLFYALDAHHVWVYILPLYEPWLSTWFWKCFMFQNVVLTLKKLYYHVKCLYEKILVILSWFYKLKV